MLSFNTMFGTLSFHFRRNVKSLKSFMNRREIIRFVFLKKITLVVMWRSDYQKQKWMWEKQEVPVTVRCER